MTRQIRVLQATISPTTRVRPSFSFEASMIMVRLSLSGEIKYANKLFLNAVSLPTNEVLGQQFSEIIHFTDKKIGKQLKELVINEKVVKTNIEIQFLDGSLHWFEIELEMVGSPDQSEIQIMGIEKTILKRMEQVIDLQNKLLLSSTLDVPALTQLFFESILALSPFMCGCLVVEGQDQQLTLMQRNGDKLNLLPQMKDESAFLDEINKLSATRVTQLSALELPHLLHFYNPPGSINFFYVIPLVVEGETLATLILGNPESSRLDETFEQQLQSLADLVSGLLLQKKEKGRLFSKEKELSNLFSSISEMLLLINEDGKVIETNSAMIGQLGLDPDHLTTIFAYHPPEVHQQIQKGILEAKTKGKSLLQIPLYNGQTSPTLVELEMVMGFWQEKPVLICLYHDIQHQLQLEELERDRRKMADVLAESAMVLNSSLNQEAVLAHILDMVVKIVPKAYTNISVLEGIRARVVASRGYEKLGMHELLHSRVMDAEKILNLKQMISTKRETLISVTKNNPNWVALPETVWINSYIGAPIIVNGEIFGFINCDSDLPGYFTETDAVNLKLFADQAAIAIENARLHQEVEQHLRKITQITELTRTVLVASNVHDVTQKVVGPLLKLFHANSIFISQWDPVEKRTICLSEQGEGILPTSSNSNMLGWAKLTEFVLAQKQAVVFGSGQESAELNQVLRTLFSDKYILALPMWVEENPFGVIFLGFIRRDQITDDDLAIGAFAANQLATAIQKTMMLESEQSLTHQYSHANELLTSLSLVAASLNSSSGPKGVMETMGEGLEKLHIHSMVFLLDEDLKHARLEYSSRQTDLMSFTQKLGQEYFFDHFQIAHIQEYDQIVNHKRSVYMSDITSLFYKILPSELVPFMHRIFEILGVSTRSKALLVPLLSENKPVGILNIYGDELMEIDRKAGETFGGQISAAFENAILLSKVQRLAVTDELTGIYNRRGLIENATNLFKVVRRFNRSLSVLMLDLDDFKLVNDQYGHDVGDEVLKGFVQQVRLNIREIDLLARYGGEEFIVVLEESDLTSSKEVAERICRFVETHPIQVGKAKLKITVSVGVAEISEEIDSFDTLVKQADESLYLAKKRGKNQVASLAG